MKILSGFLLFVLLAFSQEVLAQKSAQELFVEAGQAYEAGNLGLAQRLLNESLAMSPQSATALNLGRVHLKRGDPTQALEMSESLLGGTYGELSEERTKDVKALQSEAMKQVGHVKVVVEGDFASLNLDGRSFQTKAKSSMTLPVNPGAHVLVGKCAPNSTLCTADVNRTFEVGASETKTLTLRSIAAPAIKLEPKNEEAKESSKSFFKTPWPYLIGALLIGGAVVVGLGAGGRFRTSPQPDPSGIYPTVTAHFPY